MPPIRKKTLQKALRLREEFITRIYDIPRTTLRDRLKGIEYKAEKRANNHKLTQFEEESLVKWVLDLDRRGLPPRHSLVREIANYLLSQSGNQQVGEKWVYNLVKRRPEIDSKFSRRYNYERAKCEDLKIIQEHFDRVQDAISQYGILPEDIYNFDETGFAMGVCATAKVITGSDRYARPKLLQPGNREWVTAIEATNSTGWALPSDNGWTTDQIGLEWLKTHFIPYINDRTMGRYRMLILDGHGSHLTAEFDQNPFEGLDQILSRMSKAYETARNDYLLARKEVGDLRAANEKENQKRQRSNKQISIEQGITREEAQALVQGQVEASQAVVTAPAEPELPASQPIVRRQFRCSGCGAEGHKINRCPSRTAS
ncbi:conserved hypothetical protein [Talaromyces stipitatus ATCC 10500]|uniref:HTH CENPB-type domain-containing protein n=1 Tax=Talaromyces stipitatus (strain ATCC 10500 / CBS 375.48 / QM 6759 / NRRL 1006) TaxID=441959 RepID=B8LVR7_TALSN|nr:uncharacterized protein TSTA_075690 [Talaromyces stipitatus ATCC 10500]EED24197.1 conserved hypothetical protein [Talaromyces stipitatus ATCC 10500]